MYRERDGQESFWGSPLYEVILPSDHFLRKLADVVEFKKVNERVKDLYSSDTGRPCWEPAVMFKMLVLQFLYAISDRELEEQVRYNMAYKWFVGLSADELPPDHSTVSVFRDRVGERRFCEIFNWIVREAKAKGFVNERLHIIDSTDVQAKADPAHIPGGNRKAKKDDDPPSPVHRHPEGDARWGYKKKEKPFFGFKVHGGMDADSEIITRCEMTSGNQHDIQSFLGVLNGRTQIVSADKAYDAMWVHSTLAHLGIGDWIYRKRRKNRKVKERSWIERKFSEMKQQHGLKRARYWGLTKMKIQGYMTAMVVNLKRMVKLTMGPPLRVAVRRV